MKTFQPWWRASVSLALGALVLVASATPAQADDEAEVEVHETPYEDGGLADIGIVIGAKLGAGFSQVFTDLGTSFIGEFELGYMLPLPEPVGRSIELFVTGSYSGPSAEDTLEGSDPRLPGDGTWSYELTLKQAIIGFGLLYRIPLPTDLVAPYLGGGGRVYLTRTEVTGESGGQPFGDNEETDAAVGGFGILGADFFLGPGAVLLELQAGAAAIDNFVLQDTHTGALNIAVGYRLFI